MTAYALHGTGAVEQGSHCTDSVQCRRTKTAPKPCSVRVFELHGFLCSSTALRLHAFRAVQLHPRGCTKGIHTYLRRYGLPHCVLHSRAERSQYPCRTCLRSIANRGLPRNPQTARAGNEVSA